MNHRVLLSALTVSTALTTTGFAGAALAQELAIGIAASPTSIDPQFYVLGPNSAMARNMFDGLVNQDDRQQIQPALAESWEMLDDETWLFHLREGVTFHDGSDFTAADVVASINRVPMAAENSPSSFAPYVQDVATVEAVDPMTVRVTTNGPAPLLLNNLSRIAMMPAELEGVPTETLNQGEMVIGTGPFRFVSWSPNDNVVLERFDDYWDGPSHWEQVTYRVFTNPSARIAAILSGDVDLIESVPTADIERLEADESIDLVTTSSNRVMYLHMDQDRETSPFAAGPDGTNPLRSAEVRRAISMGINRQGLVDRIMDGQGVPAGQLVPEGYFGWSPDLEVDPYDPEAARELMAEAGYPDGFTLTFHASNDRYPNDEQIAQAIGQMLTRIGIQTDIVTLPASVYFSRASALEFSFIMGGAAAETGEASGVLGPLLETFSETGGRGNRGRYSSEAFDTALATARETLDDAGREALLQEAMEIGMGDLGVIPVFFLAHSWAVDEGVSYDGRTDGYTLAYEVSPVE